MQFPAMNPVAFHIFSWPVYWYGLMYLVGFLGGWAVLSLRLRYTHRGGITQTQLSDLVFYTAMGAILGGRIGYMLFYDFSVLIHEPWMLFETWKGGMSFHGGLLGVLIALYLCARHMKLPWLHIVDLIAPAVPIGLAAGRIGNFINGELWGRATTMPWGMVFPSADNLPRHPSQLYEFALEGVILFMILWWFSRKPRPMGAVSGLFAIGYGVFRFLVEFVREPDAQIGFLAGGWLTEGQLLSLPLIIMGVILMVYAYRRKGVSA